MQTCVDSGCRITLAWAESDEEFPKISGILPGAGTSCRLRYVHVPSFVALSQRPKLHQGPVQSVDRGRFQNEQKHLELLEVVVVRPRKSTFEIGRSGRSSARSSVVPSVNSRLSRPPEINVSVSTSARFASGSRGVITLISGCGGPRVIIDFWGSGIVVRSVSTWFPLPLRSLGSQCIETQETTPLQRELHVPRGNHVTPAETTGDHEAPESATSAAWRYHMTSANRIRIRISAPRESGDTGLFLHR